MVKRLLTAQIEQQAIELITGILNKVNWSSNCLTNDYGTDIHVRVFNSEKSRRITPWQFSIQVKGTTRAKYSDEQIKFQIDSEHLSDWYKSILPVLFVVCDVNNSAAYYIWIREYIDKYGDELLEVSKPTLSIPKTNRLTTETCQQLLGYLKRASFMHEAPKVMSIIDEEFKNDFILFDLKKHPLATPDHTIQDPALARCIACSNYFWIDEGETIGWDIIEDDMPLNCIFTRIYGPVEHQPSVYECESPEDYCPICMNQHRLEQSGEEEADF